MYQHYEIAIRAENVQNGISAVRKRDAKLHGKRSPAATEREFVRGDDTDKTRCEIRRCLNVAENTSRIDFSRDKDRPVRFQLRPPSFTTLPFRLLAAARGLNLSVIPLPAKSLPNCAPLLPLASRGDFAS